jgi:hypothetical protein
MILFMATANAALYDVKFCNSVDIRYFDEAGGNRWEDDSIDKPARGFWYEVIRTSAPTTVIESGYLATSGSNVGCTGEIELDSGKAYKVDIESRARFAGPDIDIYAYDDSATPDLVKDTVLAGFSPSADAMVYTTPLDGVAEDRWNHLALASFAVYMHNLDLTEVDIKLAEDRCCDASENWSHVMGSTKKFVVAHELGHQLSFKRDVGGSGCESGCGAPDDGCVGDSSPGVHGQLEKEYESCAACEGIADFYSAITWNTTEANAACEYVRAYALDWNIDLTDDIPSGGVNACIGDPFADTPNLVTEWNWLDDAITNGFGSCTGPLSRRSTQFGWLRYAWDMVTIQGVPLSDFWEIWDDADPYDWNKTDVGIFADHPSERMRNNAFGNGYLFEHDDAALHGL